VHILVIEDEPKVAKALKQGFGAEGIDVAVAATGEDGFFLASTKTFDVILLDCNLPGRDGYEVVATLRTTGIATPVIMLTARDSVADRVAGLDAGADDYVVKPFSFAEVLARVRALLRRDRKDQPLRLRCAELEMDLVTRRVTRNRETITLTAKEFELLEYLLRTAGQIVNRDMLARDVWHDPDSRGPRSPSIDNLIDVQMARLRKKIDEPFDTKLIHTIRGVGFMLRQTPP
jgi:two-component system, OmpR family, copper resistance phosphate regulon response regulator CusR